MSDNSALQNRILKRLRDKNLFQGARYELLIEATFIRAGFTIDYANEKDGTSKHPEFVATHIETWQKFAVEAKSRHREIQPSDETSEVRLGLTKLFQDAINKNPIEPYVIFIDLNIPTVHGNPFEQSWTKELFNNLEHDWVKNQKSKDLFNMIVFTNYPVEYSTENTPSLNQIIHISENPAREIVYKQCLQSILISLDQFGKIPNSFDE